MLEHLGHGHGVHLAAGVVALFDELLEIAAGDLNGDLVGNGLSGALFLFHPGRAGQGDPHGPSVDGEADVDRIGMAGGDGHDRCLPEAVEIFASPVVGHVEIFVHALSLTVPLSMSKLGLQRGSELGRARKWEFSGRYSIRGLFFEARLADGRDEEEAIMQVTVTVPDAIIREARVCDRSLIEFVEGLIDKGMRATQGRPDLERAMAQFRAIHAAQASPKNAVRINGQAAD